MLDTVNGLPTHPFFAHAVAALVPLTALLAVLVVVWPAARRRIGGAAAVVAAATMMAIPLTTTAGNWLQPQVMGNQALDRHTTLGGQLLIWVALLTIAVTCWWALHSSFGGEKLAAIPPMTGRIAVPLTGAATVGLAVVATWYVVRIGETGTQAAWATTCCYKAMRTCCGNATGM
jgi:hypothetical protein